MAQQNTKEKILSTALELFNTKGHFGVTTNHIAKDAGVSPGNLYYHFRNKQEIIRAIFYEIDQYGRNLLAMADSQRPGPEIVPAYLIGIGNLLNKYTFFFRELREILSHDDEMMAGYYSLESLFKEQLATLLLNLSTRDQLLKSFEKPEDSKNLASLAWVICLSWLSIVEAPSKDDENNTNISSLYDRLFFLLKPYIRTEKIKIVTQFFTMAKNFY